MTSPFSHLTDVDLDALRVAPKGKMSATRLKQKLAYLEQTFELESLTDSDVRYKLYRRHHPRNAEVFSVGLSVCIGGDWLTLCRYNGPYHAHKNFIERNRIPVVSHIHFATQRYVVGAAHPDGFAVETDRYSTIEGALRCILLDCNIQGILPSGDADPSSEDLFSQ